MAIYGQSWRGGGNMSFRNPMAKAAMNNNPMGNQQTLKPQDISAYKQAAQPWALQQSTAYQPGPAMSPVSEIKAPRPSMPPGFGDQIPDYSSAPSPAIPTANPQTPSPQGMSLNPASMQNQGIIQNPAMASQAFSLERARQYQANRQATPAAPQYINPEFRTGQANMQRLNQSMAQTLNRPLQRRADAIAGVQPGPMINPNAARNVLMGQSPDADLSMRPLNLPPRNMYEANGINPGEFRNNPSVAMNAFPDSDNFRVATGGMAMYPPPAARSVKPEYVQNSLDNARIARAARMRGVTASGIDQWRAQSPYAQGILKQSPARLAALRERMQPAAAPVPAIAPQVQPIAPQTSAVVQQPPQDSGMNNWSSATPQVQPIAPNVQAGVPQVQPDAQIPVDPKRLKAPTPYSSRIYPGMPRGEIQFKPTPNAFSSALRAFGGYQGN